MNLQHTLNRVDELHFEICENTERMLNVARVQRVAVLESQVTSIMHWAQRAAQLINEKGGNGNGNGNGRKPNI